MHKTVYILSIAGLPDIGAKWWSLQQENEQVWYKVYMSLDSQLICATWM